MADLVQLSDFDGYLGGDLSAEDPLTRQAILDSAEATFERQCGRSEIPFRAADPARVEVRDGTGSCSLWTDYPIASIASIVLGFDVGTPDQTVDLSRALFAVGGREITRRDGWFGLFGAPRYVHITYATQDDLPEDAALAVMRAAATLYRQLGSEDAKSESVGPYQSEFAVAFQDPVWLSAVGSHARFVR